MSYEAAPATTLIAINCCACGRPLVDAESVELGIGPVCRRKYGFNIKGISDEDRAAANKLVYAIAAEPGNLESLARIAQVRALGFEKLAARLEEQTAVVRLEEQDNRLCVATPYNEGFVNALRQIPGRQWNKETKTWSVPADARRALWKAMRNHLPGVLGVGPRGGFQVPAAA